MSFGSTTIGRALVEITGSDAGLTRALAGGEAELKSFGRTGSSVSSGFSSGMNRAFMVAGAGALAFAAYSLKAATDFQQQMTLIQTQAGASADSVKLLSGQVLDLAKTAEFGPTQLAQALFHLKSVGLDDASAMKALKASSDLAAVGQSDLEQTTNAVAGAWRSGISGATDFSKAVATLNAIVGAGNMRMEDLVSAISTGVLPTAKAVGLTLTDVGAAMAYLTASGMTATDAANRLRMTFLTMESPTSTASKELESIGLTSTSLAQAMQQPDGLLVALKLLAAHLQGLSKIQQTQALTAIFSKRSAAAILPLIQNLQGVSDEYSKIHQGQSQFNAAVQAQARTLSGELKNISSQIQVAAVEFGTKLIPLVHDVLAPALGFAAGNAQELLALLLGYAALKFLPGLLMKVALGLEAVSGAQAASAAEGLGKAVVGTTNLAAGMEALAGPLAVAAVGLAGLGAAASWLGSQKWMGAGDTAAELAYKLQGLSAQFDAGKGSAHEYIQVIDLLAGPMGKGVVGAQQFSQILASQLIPAYKAGKISAADWNSVLSIGQHLGVNVKAALLEQATAAKKNAAATGQDTAAQQKDTAARQKAIAALKAERQARAQLAGGILGLVANLKQLHTDQAKVNDLQKKGKQGTSEYKDAVLTVLQDQLSFNQALAQYAANLKTSGETQAQARRQLEAIGLQAGVSKQQVDEITASVFALNQNLHVLPSGVAIKITADASQADTVISGIQARIFALNQGYAPPTGPPHPHHHKRTHGPVAPPGPGVSAVAGLPEGHGQVIGSMGFSAFAAGRHGAPAGQQHSGPLVIINAGSADAHQVATLVSRELARRVLREDS